MRIAAVHGRTRIIAVTDHHRVAALGIQLPPVGEGVDQPKLCAGPEIPTLVFPLSGANADGGHGFVLRRESDPHTERHRRRVANGDIAAGTDVDAPTIDGRTEHRKLKFHRRIGSRIEHIRIYLCRQLYIHDGGPRHAEFDLHVSRIADLDRRLITHRSAERAPVPDVDNR